MDKPASAALHGAGFSESSHGMPEPALHPAVPGKLHRLNAGPCRSTGSSGPARRIGHGQALPLPRPIEADRLCRDDPIEAPEPALRSAVPKGNCTGWTADPAEAQGAAGQRGGSVTDKPASLPRFIEADMPFRELPWNASTGAPSCRPGETAPPERRTVQKRREQRASAPDRSRTSLPLPRFMRPTGFSESSHGMPEPALHPAVPGKLHRLNAGPCRSAGSSGPARRIGHGQACLCSRFYRGRQAFQRAPMECQNRRSILPSRGNCIA